MLWSQVYDPFGNMIISALVAAIPVIVLLGAIGIFEMKAHWAAMLGLVTALLVAVVVSGMPVSMAGMSALYGAAFGLMPIGWIILNVIFLYQLTSEKGEFEVLQRSIPERKRRPASAVAVHRLLTRGFLRRSCRIRHTGGRDRVNAARSRLLTARRLRPVPDRQHGAGGLWRPRLTRDRARCRFGARPPGPELHDWAPTPLLLAAGSLLVDLGVRWLSQDARSVARGPRRWPLLCPSSVPRLELS